MTKKQYKGRTYLLTVSEISICHGGGCVRAEQSSSHHNSQEEEKGLCSLAFSTVLFHCIWALNPCNSTDHSQGLSCSSDVLPHANLL